MRNYLILLTLVAVFLMNCPVLANAGCTNGVVRAMIEAGLSQQQINAICSKAHMYDQGHDAK